MEYKSQERKGVFAVAQVVTENLGWIFRELPTSDVGIDAYLEVCDQKLATGKIIALQIKSGKSYFIEKSDDGVFYRGDIDHLDYWSAHSLPVIIVLHDDESGDCYWQVVEDKRIHITGSTWKISIPFYQKFDYENRSSLKSLAVYQDNYIYNLKQLQLFKPVMIELLNGIDWYLYIETEENFKRTIGNCHYIDLCFSSRKIEGYPKSCQAEVVICVVLNSSTKLFKFVSENVAWADITYLSTSGIEEEEISELVNYYKEGFPDIEEEIMSKHGSEYRNGSILDMASFMGVGINFEAKLKANELSKAFVSVDDYLSKQLLGWENRVEW